ncbi:MAG: hypothetical protein WCK09_13625 [Bacteroidota bacterium]
MKKQILTFLLIFFSGITCFSQSFSLADDFKSLVNGSEVFQSGPSDTLQLITWLHLTNKSGSSCEVLMKKEELQMLPGGSSSICWGGYCYGPEMTVSTFPLSMLPGETVSGCFGHFGPNGCRGESVVRWVFFNQANPSDSVSVTVHYSTFPSATEPIPNRQSSLTFGGPIPADHQIVVRHSLPPGCQGRIDLRNQAGKIISASEPVSLSGSVKFLIENLPAGIYFCTLWMEEKPIVTRKAVVIH